MMASMPAYNEYANKVLMPQMDQKVLAEVKALEAKKQYESPRYMELLIPNFYTQHLLRMPPTDRATDPLCDGRQSRTGLPVDRNQLR
jgi:proline iminopeptidase